MKRIFAAVVVLSLSTIALAQEAATHESAGATPAEHSGAGAAEAEPHPVLSADGSWAGPLVIFGIIGMFFLPAAVIGPIVRALTPEDVPPPSSHDEPPGSSGHHGRSGTADTDDHGHGHSHGH